jgi:hypothetical protein
MPQLTGPLRLKYAGAIGFQNGASCLSEAKCSRTDLMADKKKRLSRPGAIIFSALHRLHYAASLMIFITMPSLEWSRGIDFHIRHPTYKKLSSLHLISVSQKTMSFMQQ